MKPFYYAILTAIIWGWAPVLEKIGLQKLNVFSALVIRGLSVAIMVLFAVFFFKSNLNFTEGGTKSIVLIALGGILASFIGQFLFYQALKNGNTSQVVPIAASYPLVAFILSIILLHESFNISKIMGVIFVLMGIFLLK